MTLEKLTELAEKENKLSKAELELKLTELKSLNCRILECIVYVRTNQGCSLSEAKEIAINSSAWIKQKDEFIEHQQEQMAEFMEAAKDDIESIKQTYSTEKTETIIKMKK